MLMKNPNKKSSRYQARRFAMQVIYQWQFTQKPADELINQFIEDHQPYNTDRDYFVALSTGVIEHVASIDDALRSCVDREISELNPVELAVLRIATYELIHCPDVPYRVVINEAIEVTKHYGSDGGHKYINGVLDRLAKKLRAVEM